jgi:tetratricopeptide (TPR) repeat protein
MTNRTNRIALGLALLALAAVAPAVWAQAATDPAAIAAEAFDLRLDGRVDEAVAALEAGLEAYPEAAILHYELARTRLYLLEIGPMIAAAEAAVQCDPDNNDYGYFAAMASGYGVIDAAHHQDTARMTELGNACFDHLEACLAHDPNDHRARCMLVEMNLNLAPEIGREVGDNEVHAAWLEKKDAVYGAKARALMAGEDGAIEIWKKLVAEHPDDCRALAEAADGLVTAGELKLAQDCLDKAIGRNKDHCYGLLRLGLAHAMQGDTKVALELTDRYLATDPPVALRAFAVGRKAVLHMRSGDRDRGEPLMAEARSIDPHVWMTVMPPPREIFVAP